MKTYKYTLRFNTPAFLGNAEQSAQWRTPPIKAQLRQWWRVAYAVDCGYRVDVGAMRKEEGLLFGHAWLENDRDERENKVAARKSEVRIRLDRWVKPDIGTLPAIGMVCHPEVNRSSLKDCPGIALGKLVDAGQYLGYGPFQKANAALQAGDSATLSLAVPDVDASRIERALWLMDRYGTLGGRSRNGWGSFALLPLPTGEGRGGGVTFAGATPLRPWREALAIDWPHAIGRDEQGALIWQTGPHGDWKALMKTLAVLKIGLRTQFVFPNAAPPHQHPLPRHWLSYPITRHTTKAFDRNARLPNQLRFKVRPTPEGKLVGVIFLVPHLPPPEFHPNRQAIIQTWQSVHGLLDDMAKPTNSRGYASIMDIDRRAQLKPQLDSIPALRRIPE
jgi:CRISPR-associated protein Cmr1